MLHFTMDMPLYFMALYGSIMIAAILLLRAFLRDRLPKFVFPLLWCFVLFRLLVPFSVSSPLSSGTASFVLKGLESAIPETAPLPSPAEAIAAPSPGVSGGFDLTSLIFPLFILGAAITAAAFLCQWLSCSRKLKNSLLIEQNETVNKILRESGKGLSVFSCDAVSTPLVFGILSPRIYLPTRINFENISLLRHILLHEAMHVKRKDNFIKLLMLITLCLNWYNPLVWLMARRLSADLESACDEAVLKNTDESELQSYAGSLLSMAVAENRRTLLYSTFSKTEVERRIKSVLYYKRPTALTRVTSLMVISLCALLLVGALSGCGQNNEIRLIANKEIGYLHLDGLDFGTDRVTLERFCRERGLELRPGDAGGAEGIFPLACDATLYGVPGTLIFTLEQELISDTQVLGNLGFVTDGGYDSLKEALEKNIEQSEVHFTTYMPNMQRGANGERSSSYSAPRLRKLPSHVQDVYNEKIETYYLEAVKKNNALAKYPIGKDYTTTADQRVQEILLAEVMRTDGRMGTFLNLSGEISLINFLCK